MLQNIKTARPLMESSKFILVLFQSQSQTSNKYFLNNNQTTWVSACHFHVAATPWEWEWGWADLDLLADITMEEEWVWGEWGATDLLRADIMVVVWE